MNLRSYITASSLVAVILACITCLEILQTNVFVQATNDDDIISHVFIPFCRKGHSLVSFAFDNNAFNSSSKASNTLLLFGGGGLNYKRPGSRLLDDTWILDLSVGATRSPGSSSLPIGEEIFKNKKTAASVTFDWQPISPSDGHRPLNRFHFGSATLSGEFFAVYGGICDLVDESDQDIRRSSAINLCADLWVLTKEGRWVGLMSSNSNSNGHTTRKQVRGIDNNIVEDTISPGPRAFPLLVSLPKSDKLLILGGYGSSSSASSGGSNSGSVRDHRDFGSRPPSGDDLLLASTSTLASTGEANEQDIGPLFPDPRPYSSSYDCLSDVLSTSLAAIKVAASNAQTQPLVWKREANLPVSCLLGAQAVAIEDPTDGREKVFIFGGKHKHKPASASASAPPNTNSMAWDGFHGRETSTKGGGDIPPAGHRQPLVYSSAVRLLDPASGQWESIEKSASSPCWPANREGLAMVYVAELQSVFVSGGKLEKTASFSFSSSFAATSDGTTATTTESENSADFNLDLWSFNLATRQWSLMGPNNAAWAEQSLFECLDNRMQRGTVKKIDQETSLSRQSSQPLPSTRFYHSMAKWTSSSPTAASSSSPNRLALVVFGGQLLRAALPSSESSPLLSTDIDTEAMAEAMVEGGDIGNLQDDFIGGANDDFSRSRAHNQINDIWLFDLTRLLPLPVVASNASSSSSSSRLRSLPFSLPVPVPSSMLSPNEAPTASGWTLVSPGGCMPGDKGRATETSVDVSAIVVVTVIIAAVLIGVASYHIYSRVVGTRNVLKDRNSHGDFRYVPIDKQNEQEYQFVYHNDSHQ